MLSIGDVYVYATDFQVAMRFWAEGLRLRVVKREVSPASSFALLEFPAGGAMLNLFGGAEPWREDERPAEGTRPTTRFDVVTSDFDDTLSRLIERGGQQLDPVETYSGVRMVTIADPDGNAFELIEVPDTDDS
ncbi:MAG: hypothetical protein AMXMBFR47_29250 [Planctomycetota bacterium]